MPADLTWDRPAAQPETAPGAVRPAPPGVDPGDRAARHGRPALRRAIAGGQYEFPLGLFFGGHGPSTTRRVLEDQFPRWVGGAESVLHLDVHTGLGARGELALLLEDSVTTDRARWLADRFGGERVEWLGEAISNPIRGGLWSWCQATFADRPYDFLCAEFGTYPGLDVLAALRAENRAHQWGDPGSEGTRGARLRLREVFAPGNRRWRWRWRSSAIARGLAAIRRGFEVGFGSKAPA